jgi:hypothetical protein
MVRIYPLLGNGYVFMGPPRGYISGTEPNQEREDKKNENGASPLQSRKKGSAEDWL